MIQYTIDFIVSLKKKNNSYPEIDKKFIKRVKKGNTEQKEIVHQIKNPWLSSVEKKKSKTLVESDPLTETIAYLTSLLNKITINNFDTIFEKIKKIKVIDKSYYVELIKVIYMKCINESNFIDIYIKIVKLLDWTNAKSIFLNLCTDNFCNWQTISNDLTIGNIYIIGSLYNINAIPQLTLEKYLDNLLESVNDLSIKLLCKLFDTVHSKYKNPMYIDKLAKLQTTNILSQHKFAIMDIVDKYNNIYIQKPIIIENVKTNIFTAIIDEYLDILDTSEVLEYYNECLTNNKDYLIACAIIDKLCICPYNKTELFELLVFGLKHNIVNKNIFTNYIKTLNLKELIIDNEYVWEHLEEVLNIIK